MHICYIAEITRKLCRKLNFRIRISITIFHIKDRKPHSKLREALYKEGLERNYENKNVLKFEIAPLEGTFIAFSAVDAKNMCK